MSITICSTRAESIPITGVQKTNLIGKILPQAPNSASKKVSQQQNLPQKESSISFNQPVKPLPQSGITYKYFTGEGIAPLGVKTQSGDLNYFVKVADWDTKETVLTMFIRSGESASVKLPLGNYEFKYATGKTWYGPDYLFGPNTSYYIADAKMDFYRSGNAYNGHTVELIPRVGGNLRTEKINKNSF